MKKNMDSANDSPAMPGTSVPMAQSSGTVKVHESVIASIARKAASTVPGVVRLAGSSFVDNLAEIVGSGRLDRAISIEMGESSVSMEIRLVLAQDCHAPSVAMAVQNAVVNEVTHLTGMHVARVDVSIMDLDTMPEPSPVPEQK